MKKLLTLTAIGAAMLATSNANAAGFFLREQSVSGQANAFAGATAGAEDISYSIWNPAGLTRHKGTQINGNLTLLHSTIDAYSHESKKTQDDVIPFAAIPSIFVSHQINNDLTAGFSLTAPFGLVSDYDDDFTNASAASQDTLSDLKTYNLTSMLAYKATDKLSLGAGLMIQYIDADLRTSIASGKYNQDFAGDTTDIGYTLGALYEFSDSTRIGVGYRSEVDHKLKGEATSSFPTGSNGDIAAKLTTPEVLSFGAYHDINDKWSVMAEAQRTGWSSFYSLDIVAPTTTHTTLENWDDVWFYSVGGSYKVNDDLKLKFGVAYDNNPVSDDYRTMRIPDSDRIWYSAGAEYKLDDNLTLNAGYTFIYAYDTTVDYKHGHATDVIDYAGNIHLLGLGFNYKF